MEEQTRQQQQLLNRTFLQFIDKQLFFYWNPQQPAPQSVRDLTSIYAFPNIAGETQNLPQMLLLSGRLLGRKQRNNGLSYANHGLHDMAVAGNGAAAAFKAVGGRTRTGFARFQN